MWQWFLFLVVAFVVVAVVMKGVQEILHKLLTDKYPVHSKGVVLVTGASSGIGLAIAVDLAKSTNLLVFASVLDSKEINKLTVFSLPNLVPIVLDVTKPESITQCYGTILTHLKENSTQFVGLINNAGLGHPIPTEIYPMQAARYVFDVNFFGLLEMTQKFLPQLRESHGRIINLSSFAGTNAFPTGSVYCATKFAVEALSDALRKELRHHKVAVCMMEPGYVRTELMHNSLAMSAKVLSDYNVNVIEATKWYPQYFDEKKTKDRHRRECAAAASPEEISRAVVHAMTAEQPYPRYRLANVLGVPTWFLIWLLWICPDSVKDMISA